MFDPQDIPNSLRDLRKRLHLSQRKFSQTYKISFKNICNWEQGIRQPGIAALSYLTVIDAIPEKVAEVLRCQ